MRFSVDLSRAGQIRIVFQRAVSAVRALFRRKRAWYAVFFLGLGVFAACSGVLFYRLYILPRQADSAMDAARSLYGGPAAPAGGSSSAGAAGAGSAPQEGYTFAQLQAVNGDVRGWITIPGTAVDYPVLCPPAASPDYYLTHDWKRETTKYGSIYMLPSARGAGQKNTILYGHSMKDGRMFAPLLQYTRPEYYSLHPTVLFQLGNDRAYWKIFAVIKTNTDPSQGQPFDYQKTRFPSAKAFSDYLGQVRVRSVLTLPVDLKSSDSILTLSTCSYEFDGFRTVVFARRVRAGEDAGVDVSKVSANDKALYPDCWYRKFGGQKP